MKKKLNIDSHVAMSFANRLWAIVAGIITVIAIPLFLSKEEQGYYFTFNSILALQLFFELGLNFVLSQIVSHEVPHIQKNSDNTYPPESLHTKKIVALLQLVNKIYPKLSLLYLIFIGLAGLLFFSQNNHLVKNWILAWLILITSSSVNLYISPYLSLTEGAGYIRDIATLRLTQSIIGYILFWIILLSGGGLLSTPLILMASAVCGIFWLKKTKNPIILLKKTNTKKHGNEISWKKEILPFQWRIALSWISGYLSLQIFNPIVFKFLGPIDAGQFGLALAAYSSILTLSITWINAKIPVIGGFFSLGKSNDAKKTFINTLKNASIMNFFGCIFLSCIILFLKKYNFSLGERFPSPIILIMITFVMLGNIIVFAIATYFRANKTEKFTLLSITIGLITLISTYTAAHYSLTAVAISYAAVTTFISVPWSLLIYRKHSKAL